MTISKPVTIVSAILQKKNKQGKKLIYLQERWKPKVSPAYSGLLEIPAGKIEAYENVYDALKREVKEECGLNIVKIISDYHSVIFKHRLGDKSFVFRPFLCQEILRTRKGLPWIGFVFTCEVAGKLKINRREAKSPQWVTTAKLKKMIQDHPEKFFPLQLPVLNYYLQKHS